MEFKKLRRRIQQLEIHILSFVMTNFEILKNSYFLKMEIQNFEFYKALDLITRDV